MMLNNVQKQNAFLSLDDVAYFPDYSNPVFCSSLPITSAEFYNAGMEGIRPEYKLVVDTECDKRQHDRIRYRDAVFAIYRRYTRPDGLTELYLERRAGVT